jgi:hypothetical protein
MSPRYVDARDDGTVVHHRGQPDDLPDRAETHDDVDQPCEGGVLAAEEGGDEVELEGSDQKPVETTHDQQDLGQDVERAHCVLLQV